MRKNTELLRAQTELARAKKVLSQALQEQPPAAVEEETATTFPAAQTSVPVQTTLPTGVKEYTIKDGDSFWKIAASELGNGTRYKDIIAANPGMNENTTLAVGTKIKLPAK